MREYIYLGDKMTAPELVGVRCQAVLRADGKCIVGRGAMLVQFGSEAPRVVLRRRLRKVLSNGAP